MSDLKTDLYSLNKSVVATEKPLKDYEIKDAINRYAEPFFTNSKDSYYMLLCRERYDFTLFNFVRKKSFVIGTSLQDLRECLTNRGQVLSIENTENKDALEIWLLIDEEPYCYYLFPYDLGVVEVV
ncbi:MAG: hypothetical protein LUC37_06010 [Prevotella sp.]|nr:hypothetical protein [Prevotella sp.]